MELNKLRDEAYKIACEHGWHDKDFTNQHWLMLIITEIGEAVEADRKNKHANRKQYEWYLDYAEREEYLTGEIYNRYIKESFENEIKDTVEDELADVVIRCLDLAGTFDIKLPDELIPSDKMVDRLKQISFTEFSYSLCNILSDNLITIGAAITLVLLNVFAKCRIMDIDIEWHINEKMKYNQRREYKHGKQY